MNKPRELLEKDTAQIKAAKTILEQSEKELLGYEETMRENEGSFEEIKKKLVQYKKNDIKIPVAYAQKYQQFQLFQRKLELLREEHREKLEHFTQIREQYISLQNDIFDARIINHDRWHNYNEVIFKLIEPPIDITYFPMDGSDESVLGLHQDENGEFSIKVLSK